TTHKPIAAAPSSAASEASTPRDVRPAMVAASDAPATTAEAANAISAASVRCTASGYAHQDERERQQDDRSRQRLQRLFRNASQRVRVERIGSPVLPLDPARHARGAPANVPHLGREAPLRVAQQGGGGRGDDGFDSDLLGRREERRQDRERSPRKREPEIAVQRTAEQ